MHPRHPAATGTPTGQVERGRGPPQIATSAAPATRADSSALLTRPLHAAAPGAGGQTTGTPLHAVKWDAVLVLVKECRYEAFMELCAGTMQKDEAHNASMRTRAGDAQGMHASWAFCMTACKKRQTCHRQALQCLSSAGLNSQSTGATHRLPTTYLLPSASLLIRPKTCADPPCSATGTNWTSAAIHSSSKPRPRRDAGLLGPDTLKNQNRIVTCGSLHDRESITA